MEAGALARNRGGDGVNGLREDGHDSLRSLREDVRGERLDNFGGSLSSPPSRLDEKGRRGSVRRVPQVFGPVIDCDYCTWRGHASEVGEHLDSSPECASYAIEAAEAEEELLTTWRDI